MGIAKGNKRISFYIDLKSLEYFKDVCKKNDISPTRVLGKFISLYNDDQIYFTEYYTILKMKKMGTEYPIEMIKNFKLKCLENDIAMSQVINTFICMVCDNRYIISKESDGKAKITKNGMG